MTHDARPLPTDVTTRACTPADLPRVAALLTGAHPDFPVAVETLEQRDEQRQQGEPFERLLIERGGQLIGMTEVSVPVMEDHPGWLQVAFTTLDADLGPALLDVAEAGARRLGAHTLVRTLSEPWWENAVYAARGYREHDRMWPSTLDLTTLDFTRFTEQEARATAAGVAFRSLSSFGVFDEEKQRRVHALWTAIERDIPSTVPLSEWDFGTWQRHVLPALTGHEDGFWLAVAPDGEWVGMTGLYEPLPGRPGTVQNDLTGVLPAWRGHGIGLALKLAAARAARERGFRYARTSNHSLNRPMLAINDAMGFVRETARVTLLKRVPHKK